MPYWVYHNTRARGNRARIHDASCRYCNDGRGQRGGTAEANGKWLGPYSALEDALACARGTGADAILCGHGCVRT